MLKISTSVKVGAITKKIEVNLYSTRDVADALHITPVAVVVAAKKAGVGFKDAGSIFFTDADISALGKRPGRGRPSLNEMPNVKGWKPPKREGEFVVLGIPTNLDDIASGEIVAN